ncbi:MAG TPA: hypothetical protein VFP34_06190 [Microlunatus sp.]|nr:hypothetical protein [Microlunatus sp.]
MRWDSMEGFVAVGFGCVIAGGLVAAVTGPTGFRAGSWVAAYLVLVAGVAQIGLGVGQRLLAVRAPSPSMVVVELFAWNAGSAAVVTGTLTGSALVVGVGGAGLAAALGLFLYHVRRSRSHRRWQLMLYRGLAALLAVSIPVGLFLSVLRHR